MFLRNLYHNSHDCDDFLFIDYLSIINKMSDTEAQAKPKSSESHLCAQKKYTRKLMDAGVWNELCRHYQKIHRDNNREKYREGCRARSSKYYYSQKEKKLNADVE